METTKPITVQHLLDNFEAVKPDVPICESCFHILDELDGDEGIYLMCPNDMCLDNTEYYV